MKESPQESVENSEVEEVHSDPEIDIAFSTQELEADSGLFNKDDEGNDLGGLMSMIAQVKKGGKKKKRRVADDDDEDAATILARLDNVDEGQDIPMPAPKGKKGKKRSDDDRDLEGLAEGLDTLAVASQTSKKNDSKTISALAFSARLELAQPRSHKSVRP